MKSHQQSKKNSVSTAGPKYLNQPPTVENVVPASKIITIKEELIEAGASREEIRDAFKMKLEEWNIEIRKEPMPTPQ